MNNLEAIPLKINKMLECLNRKNIYFHISSFPNKIGLKERKELRQKMVNQIKTHKDFKKHEEDFNWKKLLQPGGKPNCPFVSISISHCNFLGAFLFVFDKKLSIGFDIEQKNRITDKLVNRISLKTEIKQSPSPSILWVAKEASFKCFSGNQDQFLLSHCLISHWKKTPIQDIYLFKSHLKTTNKTALGTACLIDNLALAYVETFPLIKL